MYFLDVKIGHLSLVPPQKTNIQTTKKQVPTIHHVEKSVV